MLTAEIEATCLNEQKQKNQYAMFEHFSGVCKHGLPPATTTVLRWKSNNGQRNTLPFDFIPIRIMLQCVDAEKEE
jgi:hypothetical protein